MVFDAEFFELIFDFRRTVPIVMHFVVAVEVFASGSPLAILTLEESVKAFRFEVCLQLSQVAVTVSIASIMRTLEVQILTCTHVSYHLIKVLRLTWFRRLWLRDLYW